MKDFTKNYFELLNNDYKGINLTRINDYKDFELKQIKDSIEPYLQSDKFKQSLNSTRMVVDIGFGGGFPILPLAKLLPDVQFIGIETRKKKVDVVSEIAKKLELANVKLFHDRIENIEIDLEVTCTLKAVGKVNDFLDKINSTANCEVFFYKGPNLYELESDQINQAKKQWKIIEEKEIDLPGVEKRRIIGFRNKESKSKVINLVKLSELI